MHHRILHDFAPPSPDAAIAAHQSAFERARQMLREARTDEESDAAAFWMQNASGEIERWQARKAEAGR